MVRLAAILFSTILVHACGGGEHTEAPTQKQVNKDMETVNRQLAIEERAQIDGFIERRGWTMSETGTGLRYMIYENGNGELAKTGQRAEVNYRVSLINGTEIYSSDANGSKEFTIGQDNVESGLHEGILLMKPGDKAIFILPSHLAHGLMGDNNKIPPRSSVVYDIELLALK
ncbi:MAG: FKBP-type peptidyl-prolyl cis-trans isomerase [Flavobacteriales bacterium]